MHSISEKRGNAMEKIDDFRNKILEKIEIIDKIYKSLKTEYAPNERENLLREFLEDIWGVRFEDETLNDRLKSAVIQLLFISKENPNNVFSKNFRINKMNPKGKKTTPLWYLVAKLSEDNRDYDFYLSPNIYIRTKGNLENNEKNIVASNCYFVDIDQVDSEKPIYNCTEEEIKEYLEKTYPFLKECGYSYCLMSGRGLHLYFTLKYTEYLFGAKYRNYRRIEHRKLTSGLIQVMGADSACKNLNRVLRVPFSINRKINVRTRFYAQEGNCKKFSREMLRETLNPFIESVESPVKEQTKAVGKRKRKEKKENNTSEIEYTEEVKSELHYRAVQGKKTLYENRKADLETWYELHKSDMVGKRHHFFFIYSLMLKELGFSDEAVEKRCFYLNDGLSTPLPDNELLRNITHKNRYLFRNKTIAEWLDFTQAEIASFKCNYSAEEMLEHRKEKNAYFHEKEKEKRGKNKQEKQERIFELIEANDGISMSELAKHLFCSKATAWRWYKKYAEVRHNKT